MNRATSISNAPNLVEDRAFPLGQTELLPLWSEWVFLSQGDVASGVFLMRLVSLWWELTPWLFPFYGYDLWKRKPQAL